MLFLLRVQLSLRSHTSGSLIASDLQVTIINFNDKDNIIIMYKIMSALNNNI